MNNLNELCDYLNSVDTRKINLHLLPKFGGFKPACSGGVFSWDETRIIISKFPMPGFEIVAREILDVMPEPGTPEFEILEVSGEWGTYKKRRDKNRARK